jgi:hypothetical protein
MSENKKMSLGKKVLIGLGIFLVLGIIANLGNDPETKTVNTAKKKNNPEKEIQAIKISAEDLFAEYEKNGVAADNKFKGKEIEVSGEIESIDKDFLDELFVNLKGDEIGMLGVQCYFKDKNNNDLSNLKKGDSITIIGIGNGKTINVTLKKCRLKK